MPSLKLPDDLSHQALIHVLGYREGWGTWLSAAGATTVDAGRGLQVDASITAFEVAAHGGGIALGRTSLAVKERASGRLIAPFDLEVPVDEAFHLLQPKEGNAHPDAEIFKSWLLSAVSQ